VKCRLPLVDCRLGDKEKKMAIRQEIIDGLFQSLDAANELMPPENQVPKSLDLILISEQQSGGLDSLGFVTFIATIEDWVEQRFNISLQLFDEIDNPENPLETVESLAEFILNHTNS
jgi:acyl carrier protein